MTSEFCGSAEVGKTVGGGAPLGRAVRVVALLALVVASAACGAASDNAWGSGGAEDAATSTSSPVVLLPPLLPRRDAGAAATAPSTPGDEPTNASSDAGFMPPTQPDAAHAMGTADAGVPPATVTSSDGFSASRTACINEINRLRATQSLPPYTLVNTPAVDTCVDEQATYDEAKNSAHDAWMNNIYPTCNGNAQDECPDWGTDPTSVVGCLDAMWAEQDNANCKGCVGCTAFGGACPGCDYYGMMGPECGHYVNMSATYFSVTSCGFATGGGTWSVQNFE